MRRCPHNRSTLHEGDEKPSALRPLRDDTTRRQPFVRQEEVLTRPWPCWHSIWHLASETVRINVSCLYYPVCVFSYHDLNGPRWPVLTNCPSPILFIFFFCILMTIILRELEVFSLFLKYFECLINFHCSKHQFIKKKTTEQNLSFVT
jgi:hypothetical protein